MGTNISDIGFYYINYDKADKNLPWKITLTDKDISKVINEWLASDFEINVPCWSFKSIYHYLACKGVLSWNGTKAIISK
jgi:hypothetical protein